MHYEKSINSHENKNKLPEEIPGIFGTPQERKERFIKMNNEIDKQIELLNVPSEEFKNRLDRAVKFMEKTNLYHRTESTAAREIFEKKSDILSSAKIENKIKKWPIHTYGFDKENDLDKFVFLSMELERFKVGDTILNISTSVLKDQPTIVTFEDIMEIMRYKTGLTQWETDLLSAKQKQEILNEYRSQVLNGHDFYQIFCKLLAIFYENSPEEYYTNKELSSKIKEKIKELLKIEGDYKINPEIKVLNRVPFKKIKGVKVSSQEQKDLFIRAGVSPENVSISS